MTETAFSMLANARFEADTVVFEVTDGRFLTVPLMYYPRLHHAFSAQRNAWQLLGDGYAIEWPDLDEHIGVEGLLAGRRSGESEQSFQRRLSLRR